jgi:hypothetical protein
LLFSHPGRVQSRFDIHIPVFSVTEHHSPP